MIENRYLKPKEAVCSVCGDKIKVGEKYALGTVKAYTEDIVTYEEIFCGFCKPTSFEYDGMHTEEGCIRVPLINDHKKNISHLEIMKEHINDMSSDKFEEFALVFGYSMAPDMIKRTLGANRNHLCCK